MAAPPELHDDILIEIFSRLPAKSVGQCRILAKQWRKLLSTPQFIKSHLTKKPHQENLILITPSQAVHSIAAIKDDVDAVSRKVELKTSYWSDFWSEVWGSCDGLVFLVKSYEKFLVNPVTLQQVKIPDSPVLPGGYSSSSMYGFGYDSVNDDYKVVAVSWYDSIVSPARLDTYVHVYSVRSGVWKASVDFSPYEHGVAEPGAFVNGAIHWVGSRIDQDYRFVIVAFNFVNEVFDEIPAPSEIDLEKFSVDTLEVIGGCLCIVHTSMNEFWIMKEYGVQESWTKFRIDADCDWKICKPLCFIGDDQVVLLVKGRRRTLVVYNLKEGTWRDMVVDGVPAHLMDGCTFSESLVPPDFSAN